MAFETVLSIALGIGLAASVGFRVFVPLFILSLMAYLNIIPLNENWQWIGSFTALVTLGIATVFEIAAYVIPFVDNLLDTLAIPLAAIAGTLVMVSTITELSPVITWALAIIAGGGSASLISGATGAGRAVSSTSTAGIGNPVYGVLESTTAVGLSLLSVFLPLLALIIVVGGIIFILKKFNIAKRFFI